MSDPDRLALLQRQILAYRQALLRTDAQALHALQDAYAPSQRRLARMINELADLAADGDLMTSEVMRLERVQELLRLVNQEVTNLAKVAGQTIPETQQAVIAQALGRAQALTVAQAPTISAGARIAVDWTVLNRGAVEDLVGSLSDGTPLNQWLQDFVPDAIQIVKDTLLNGVAQGINPNALADALTQATDLPLHRALTLARTETLNSYRSASIRSFQANEDVLDGWTWLAAHDDKTCMACLAKSGHDFPLTVSFMPSHPRCITGDTRIQAEGVKAVSKRWYSGRLIEIETTRGHRLAVTPNHPLLTPQGWVAAGLVKEGDDLISSDGEQWTFVGNDDNEHVPPRVEEVAHALSVTRGVLAVEVPSAPPDFHGDGMEGEIDVIYADRELGRRIQSALAQQFGERHFVMADMNLIPLSSDRHSLAQLDGLGNASHGIVGSSGERGPLFGRGIRHSQEHTGALIPWRHTCQDQSAANDATRYPESGSGRLLGLTGLIERDDSSVIDTGVGTIGGSSFFATQSIPLVFGSEQALFDEDALQPDGAETANAIANGLHAFTGNISPDRIVKIVNRAFSGHVYNLESDDGYYLASGIITHNCRCSPAPKLKGDSLLPRIETGKEWFDRQPETFRRNTFPPGLRGDYDAGRVGIQDMAHLRENGVWGDSYQVSTIGQARANAARRTR